jgi:hypothetical protein
MSAIGTKQTFPRRQSMSAIGDKADSTDLSQCPLLTQSGHQCRRRIAGFWYSKLPAGSAGITSNARLSAVPDDRTARLGQAPSRNGDRPRTNMDFPSQVPSPNLVRHPKQMRGQSPQRRPDPIRLRASRPIRHANHHHRASRLHANHRPNALRRCRARKPKGWRPAQYLRKTSRALTSLHL